VVVVSVLPEVARRSAERAQADEEDDKQDIIEICEFLAFGLGILQWACLDFGKMSGTGLG
jgi:hypothetical protein